MKAEGLPGDEAVKSWYGCAKPADVSQTLS